MMNNSQKKDSKMTRIQVYEVVLVLFIIFMVAFILFL
jgi:hypothetical protein